MDKYFKYYEELLSNRNQSMFYLAIQFMQSIEFWPVLKQNQFMSQNCEFRTWGVFGLLGYIILLLRPERFDIAYCCLSKCSFFEHVFVDSYHKPFSVVGFLFAFKLI